MVIQTNKSFISQTRVQTENYKNRITMIQSKYVALHVALFWGIGTFNIKKGGLHKNRIRWKNNVWEIKNENNNSKWVH